MSKTKLVDDHARSSINGFLERNRAITNPSRPFELKKKEEESAYFNFPTITVYVV